MQATSCPGLSKGPEPALQAGAAVQELALDDLLPPISETCLLWPVLALPYPHASWLNLCLLTAAYEKSICLFVALQTSCCSIRKGLSALASGSEHCEVRRVPLQGQGLPRLWLSWHKYVVQSSWSLICNQGERVWHSKAQRDAV